MADDILNTLKGILGDNAEEKIKSVLSSLGSSESDTNADSYAGTVTPSTDSFSSPPSDSNPLDALGGLKTVFDSMGASTDSRTNLLMSLRPYMRSQRQQSIDSAIKLLNISKFSGLFKL